MPSSEEDDVTRFLIPQGVGNTEDIERYELGGFHPVHLGDRYDGGRYRVVHKLGAGGFSTVWLARDERDQKWVALKVVDGVHSTSIAAKSDVVRSAMRDNEPRFVVEHQRQFTFDGPNGHHLCLVLPVLGPSLSELSQGLTCRLTPELARRVAYEAVSAIADLHSRGICHGDVTTGNLLLDILDIDHYGEDDIYRLFGHPVTGVLETESGITAGPEAPRYIVKSVDFLSTTSNIICPKVKLIDFDQCFPISSPPKKMLGTPIEFLAPEVAIGMVASPASDIWALGCCILRLRSGEGPFSNPFDVTSPADLLSYIIHTLGEDMPRTWQDTILWDSEGQPTKDASTGKPHEQWWDGDERSLRDMIYNIWDEPTGRAVQTGTQKLMRRCRSRCENQPFPRCFSNMVWNPRAIKVHDAYLSGYNDEWDMLLEALPKISEHEATLLYDLLSKILVYDSARRPTAREMLTHPWFHFDELKF
ncbi:hypothetical protein HIM_08486 [Hirsutella minnesotensis 3608]|uniref:EKC/KEOPS complex subunit BUD32 n=1 Tax=Hirsutella minnesotensis 3608 TaxID=1043627 RepID=A0A0F7ZSX3_9HYPO|nr:hypothetical protein HIM_08486 [Hirsutella minnesotensis 3608]